VTDHEDDIDDAVNALVAALDDGDIDAVLALAIDTVVFIGSGEGEQAVGRAAVQEMFEQVAVLAEGTEFHVDFPQVDVEVIGDVAIAHAFGTATLTDDEGEHDTEYRMTAVFVDVEGEWLLASYHGSEPAPW